jgi:hypothetical protein
MATRPLILPNFRRISTLLVSTFCCMVCFAQQPNILAPHKPVAPRLEKRLPWSKPMAQQSAVGGLWMTDVNTKAALYLKNVVKTDSVTVTPILYLSNGTHYPLAPITLGPSGTAIVDINQGLASQGIAPYAKLYGYAEIQYNWPWAAITASIRDVNAVDSLIFIYPLQPSPAGPSTDSLHDTNTMPNSFEGLWWKQEKNVSGFLGLANVTSSSVNATVRLTDSTDAPIATYQVAISPHGTKMVSFDELKVAASDFGGVYLTHDGVENALSISGGLLDEAVGYSAHLWLLPSSPMSSHPVPPAVAETTFAELGLMTGAADAMMNFPSGTKFTPYSVIRNITDQPMSVTPTVWWMAGGAAQSAQLPQVTLAPHRTLNMNVPSLIAAAGLKSFNGSVNVILETKGVSGGLLVTSGAVDEKNTYVFEVMPRVVAESSSKTLCYWSIGDGDDTMVTLWNPSDENQDLVFTLFYTGGHYAYPIQLAPRATRNFNISEILHSAIPDADGNLVPAGISEGSAEIAGSQGDNDHILVSIESGVYNVRKAICGTTCVVCNGVTGGSIAIVPVVVSDGSTAQETFYEDWSTGSQYNYTSQGKWSSNATTIATVSAGLVTGVGPGAFAIGAEDPDYEPEYIPEYCTPAPTCPVNQIVSASGDGNATPTITSITPDDVLVGSSNVQLTIEGTGFGSSPTVNVPSGVTLLEGQASTNSKIVVSVNVSINATIGPNSMTVTANSVSA